MGRVALACIVLIAFATPAAAGPVGAAIAGIAAAFKGSAVLMFAGRFLLSVGASLLMRAMAPKPDAVRAAGIKTTTTAAGGTTPCSFIIGTYATGGSAVCPTMSHGKDGETPNAWLTDVIELGDIPGQTLQRIILNDRYVPIGDTPHPDYGLPLLGELEGFAWVKYYDGTQSEADPMLLAKYGSYPERPWTADMIGRGLCYAILTCRYSRTRFSGLPRFRFEMGGIPLYDPRRDSTVGGAGAHRWANLATWEPSANPALQIYNILRGIPLEGGYVWGGRIDPADLPLDNWMSAMNTCDQPITNAAEGTVPQYRAGFEIGVDEEPAAIVAELLKACAGQMADVAGVWKIRIGPPGLPVHFFTDDDVIISRPSELAPWPGLDRTWNAVHATYPEPASLWEEREAPPLYDAGFEALDGDRQLPADLALPAVSHTGQVQRLMKGYLAEERRFRRHGLTLPPEAAVLEPLDAGAWTSAANGYTAKVFEVSEVVDEPTSCLQQLSLREREPGDFVPPEDVTGPPPGAGGTILPAPQPVEAWAVSATTVKDGLAVGRRPAVLLSWSGTGAEDALFVRYELRVKATGDVVASGLADASAGQVLIAAGILPVTEYEAQGRYVLDRPTEWSSWLSATTPDVRLSAEDIAALVDIFRDQGLTAIENVTALPSIANYEGRRAYLLTDGKLYLYTGGAWTKEVDGADLAPGTIAGDRLIANTITGGLLAAAGIITDVAQINNALITGAKIADLTVDTLQIAGNAVSIIRVVGPASGSGTIASLSFTPSPDVDLVVWLNGFCNNAAGNGASITATWRGSLSLSGGAPSAGSEGSTAWVARQGVFAGGSGSGTMVLSSTVGTGSSVSNASIIVAEFKR